MMAEATVAHELWQEGSANKLRTALYPDGVIVCCSIVDDREKCCTTSPPGQQEGYWDYLAHLEGQGYNVSEIGDNAPQPGKCTGCGEKMKSLLAPLRTKWTT